MASAAVDNAKALVDEQLALLRVKLNQIPALQEVEVRGIRFFILVYRYKSLFLVFTLQRKNHKKLINSR